MSTNHQKDDQSGVLLTLDTGSMSVVSIEIAVAIAKSNQSRLHGLFIENKDLLRVASLPFTREISFTTAEERPIDFKQMQRSLQATASLFKKSLKQAALASKIPWSFDYVSNSSREDIRSSWAGFSYKVIGQRIASRDLNRQYRPTRRVLLIEDHSPNLTHALRVVLQRFGQDNVEVTKICVAPADRIKNTDLSHFLDHIEPRVSLIELRRDQLTDLLLVAGSRYDCAIISEQDDHEYQRELLELLHCPLILAS